MSSERPDPAADLVPVVRRRLVEVLLAAQPRPGSHTAIGPATDPAAVRASAAALGPDGRWPDIDYASRDHGGWEPQQHLARLRRLAVLVAGPDLDHRDDAGLVDAALAAIDGFVTRRPASDNWWYGAVGVPIALGDTLVLLDRWLPPALRSAAAELLPAEVSPAYTGQNLVWGAEGVLRRGLTVGAETLVRQAFAAARSTVVVTGAEGIQADGSFHQHGPQLYVGSYGHDFLIDSARLAFLGRGTAVAYDPAAIDVLTNYLLDGAQWFARGGTADFTAMGRVIARPTAQSQPAELSAPAQWLLDCDCPRADEVRALVGRLTDPKHPALQGHRHFWRSDHTAHHRAGWAVAVHMTSTRTAPPEAGNREGLRSWHLGDGITPIWQRGDEYRDIFPVWDWRRLPGLTAEQGAGPLPVRDWATGADGRPVRGGSDRVGGLADGGLGLASMRLDHDGLQATKTWCLLADEMIALGAGIAAPQAIAPVVTTLDQRRACGPLTVDPAERWAQHDGCGYVVLDDGRLHTAAEHRTGSWHDINGNLPPDPVEVNVVTVTIDHGRAPADAAYSYAVIPGSAAEQTASYAAHPTVDVLANTAALQAVWHRRAKVLQAAFHRAGTLPTGRDLPEVSVDAPVLLQVRYAADGTALLAVADPRQCLDRVRVRVAGRELAVDLPAGAWAGGTSVVALS